MHTRTGDRVEIVLSANSYLRLGGKARVEVLSDDYPAIDVGLLEGEAVVDSEGTGGKHQVFSVSTSAGRLRVVRPGFYRIRVHPERPVGVTVFSGRLSWLGPGDRQSDLSQRRHYSLDPLVVTPSVRRMDKYEWATLDPWGMERSAFLLNCFWGRRPLVSVPEVTRPVRANAGYQIKSGGGLRTTGNSRAELLLSPGTYLRLVENTEIEVIGTTYKGMRFRVVHGTVIIESASLNPRIHSLTMSTPSARASNWDQRPVPARCPSGSGVGCFRLQGKSAVDGSGGEEDPSEIRQALAPRRFIFFFVEAEVVGPRQGPPKGPDQPLEPAAGTGTCAGERRSLPGKTGFRLPRFRLSEPRWLGSQFQVTMVHLCPLRLLPSLTLWIPLHQHPLDPGTRLAGPDDDCRKTKERISARLR